MIKIVEVLININPERNKVFFSISSLYHLIRRSDEYVLLNKDKDLYYAIN